MVQNLAVTSPLSPNPNPYRTPAPAIDKKATNINESLAQFDLKRDKLKLFLTMQHEQN
jgi:hypothetical protein